MHNILCILATVYRWECCVLFSPWGPLPLQWGVSNGQTESTGRRRAVPWARPLTDCLSQGRSGFDPGSCEMCAGQCGTGTGFCRTHWHWDVCAGHGGTGTGLCRTRWHWDRFVPARVALGQVCAGHSGTGAGLCRTQWHWDRFLTDYVDCLPSGLLQQCTIFTYICIFLLTLATRTSGWKLGTFKQGAILSDKGQLRAALSHCYWTNVTWPLTD